MRLLLPLERDRNDILKLKYMLGQQDNINLEVNEKKQVFLRLYGMLYILIIAVIIGLGIVYLNSITNFSVEKIVPNSFLKDSTVQEVDLPTVKGTVSPPVDIMKEGKSTPELVEKGKTLFSTNCASCHGTEGKGDGVAGASLNPKPRNFHDLNGWKNGAKFSQIYKTLQEGITGTAMPSFSTLLPEDRIAILHYIRTFTSYPEITDAELTELDKTYSLSAGIKQPNQISVKLAIEKVLQDYKPVEERVKKISETIKSDNSSEGAILFKKISKNVEKSVTTLVSNPKWNENENELVKLIGNELIYNGFKTNVYELAPQQVAVLYLYLKNLFETNKT
jgi:mono/diheme cytochrome c family protein